MKYLIKSLIKITLFLINLIKLMGGGLVLFGRLLAKPLSVFLKLFYYILIFPVYRFYLLLAKRAGFNRAGRQKFFNWVLADKRLIHFLIIIFTGCLVYGNLTAANQDITAEEAVGNTILARLVSDELASSDTLIEEGRGPNRYGEDYNLLALSPQTQLTTYEEVFDESNDETVDSGTVTVRSIPDRSEPVSYVVKQGDTLSTIAQSFGISVNTVLWANNLTARSYIRPGDKLSILPVTGVLHKVTRGESIKSIASKYGVGETVILEINRLANANQIKIGQQILIPGGRPLSSVVAVVKKSATTAASERAEIQEAKASASPVYGNKMNWPTVGFRITQYYSWRHNGLDIANKTGTPIYAADAGVVEVVGYNAGGYGNQIVINHGGGKKTRYAHLSAFAVKVGQEVGKGQNIGAMGSTGRSTGPHVHFEVMINGARYNPLNYVSY
ncbi:hypothetical protein COT94_02195 [Candidatus Falkowbacteria bacterium CG10_big_fil_rev_8_21_14_0_10_37_14]|uniref:LysM domain-containing protein n=1 Tax=Candidatus Falkowbacteria bacterium CG10_big_fil_rev_8_21_14_0_10_37_14 TaxID=1974561 RepID=A0A2M6WTE3_9BACT|nr:M23 family metallopeptidase [Candidatus Falkowbacteria bacterium]PIT96052.1 MAG: hypothetical protein COT94_02195 [Candidatus Falkowbacteria bacterium CG10_big_fil_rev_8_21_14_0_10_37_14]